MRRWRSACAAILLLLIFGAQSARAADGGASIGGGAAKVGGGVAPDAVWRKQQATKKKRAAAKKKKAAALARKKRAEARKKALAKAKARAKARAKAKAKAKKTPKAKPPATSGTWFPLLGTDWSYGTAVNRFGAKRSGHVHEGQDILAPDGTPIVSPIAGTVTQRANQPGGAGLYLVILGTDGRAYVFMHIQPNSMLVKVGDLVKPREHIADVGHTGDAEGSHLHFEIWTGTYYGKGSKPIDPLPELKTWRHG